jgi:hypothetical protein
LEPLLAQISWHWIAKPEQKKWSLTIGESLVAAPFPGVNTAPVVAGGVVYFGAVDG